MELEARPDSTVGLVLVNVLRRARNESKSDRALTLSAGAARELMRALQAAADEADRRAYAWAKTNPHDLSADVAAVARRLSASENDGGASVGHPCRCTLEGPFAGLHLSTCTPAQLGTPPAQREE